MFSQKVKVLPLPNRSFVTLSGFVCPLNIHTICTPRAKKIGHECVYCWVYYPHLPIMLPVQGEMEKVRKRVMTVWQINHFLIYSEAFLKKKIVSLFLGLQGLKYVNQNVIVNWLRRALMRFFFHDDIAPACEKQGVEVWRVSYKMVPVQLGKQQCDLPVATPCSIWRQQSIWWENCTKVQIPAGGRRDDPTNYKNTSHHWWLFC